MGIRDVELTRLKNYAAGMNVSVNYVYVTKPTINAGFWNMNGSEIIINITKNQSKIDTILYLIHELGHHLSYIHDDSRVHPKGLEPAIAKENENKKLSKKERRLILESESKGMKWWRIIYNETNMQFPLHLLYRAREFDYWYYNYFAQVNKYPGRKEKINKLKELKSLFNKNTDLASYEKLHFL